MAQMIPATKVIEMRLTFCFQRRENELQGVPLIRPWRIWFCPAGSSKCRKTNPHAANSVYMYICVCIYLYISVYICIYPYISVYVYMDVWIYGCTDIWIYGYMYICIYVCMHMCICVYVYMCICVYMYICIYVCIYFHGHFWVKVASGI